MKRIAIFGATSAIAEATARLLAADRGRFVLIGRDPVKLEAVARDLRVRGAGTVETVQADLADPALHEALVARTWSLLDGLDTVLLAHGALPDQKACESDAGLTLSEISVNFLSHVSLLTHLANRMEVQGRGTIAAIGSPAGDRGRQSNYVYGSAKGGLAVFVQGLRHRLGPKGIAVTLIEPGFVDTPMTAALPKGTGPAAKLWASPDRVAQDIRRALDRGPARLYTPWFWRWIMLLVRALPDSVFQRTRL